MPAIYTRTGDKGDTGLYGGGRIPKDSLRVEAYGSVDEANALIGQAKAAMGEHELRPAIHRAQQRLFVLGAELASTDEGRRRLVDVVGKDDVAELEHLIDQCLEITGPPNTFVVPGRDPVSAGFHVARAAVRRAERRLLTLTTTELVRPELVQYLNRLSDALYATGRVMEELADERMVREVVLQNLANAGLLDAGQSATGHGQPPSPPRGLKSFDIPEARRMAEAVHRAATAMGLPVVFAAVDPNGTPILLERMPGALLVSLDLAVNKAWTSAALRQPTDRLKDQVTESGELYGLQASNQGRVVVFGGGHPIIHDGKLLGAIGISGGTVEQDMALVRAALDSEGVQQ